MAIAYITAVDIFSYIAAAEQRSAELERRIAAELFYRNLCDHPAGPPADLRARCIELNHKKNIVVISKTVSVLNYFRRALFTWKVLLAISTLCFFFGLS